MAKIELNLASDFTVASRGKSVSIDATKLSPAIVQNLIEHGLTQKIADAAAGAMKVAGFEGSKFSELSEADQVKVQDAGKALMQKVVDALLGGEWGTRVAGAGVSDETRTMRVILGEQLRAAKKWDTFKDMEADARAEALDALFAKQTEAKQAAIMAVVAQRLEEAKRAKAQAKAMAEELTF